MSKSITDKIAALFRLAENNPSPIEAQRALEMARDMLRKHNMTEADISLDDPRGSHGGDACIETKTSRLAFWKKALMQVIAEYFDAESYFQTRYTAWSAPQKVAVFYGIAMNANIAASTFVSVCSQIDSMALAYPGKGMAKREYREGIVSGLSDRLKELKASQTIEETAIMLVSEQIAKQWEEDNNLKFRTSSYQDRRGYTGESEHRINGRVDSTQITLNPVLDEG